MDKSVLGFQLVTVPYGDTGTLKTFARFVCVECGQYLDVPRGSGTTMNPEAVAERARRAGWKAKAYRFKANTYCAECKGKPLYMMNGSDKKMPFTPMNTTAPRQPTPVLKESASAIAQEREQPAAPPPTPQPVVFAVKEPTQDQRLALRHNLDQWFDDSAGAYLDGWNDNRIAELVGVTRVVVERVREAAYGPIRVDTEMVKIRAELAALRNEIEAIQKGVDRMKADGAALGSRIEQYIARGKPV